MMKKNKKYLLRRLLQNIIHQYLEEWHVDIGIDSEKYKYVACTLVIILIPPFWYHNIQSDSTFAITLKSYLGILI